MVDRLGPEIFSKCFMLLPFFCSKEVEKKMELKGP